MAQASMRKRMLYPSSCPASLKRHQMNVGAGQAMGQAPVERLGQDFCEAVHWQHHQGPPVEEAYSNDSRFSCEHCVFATTCSNTHVIQ